MTVSAHVSRDNNVDSARPEKVGGALLIALQRYQAGESEPWTTVILEAMEGRIRGLASRLPTVQGNVDREDLEQQLRLEVLVTAQSLRLDAELWIPRMLLERAGRGTRRWIRRQARVAGVPLSDSVEAAPKAGLGARAPFIGLVERAGISTEAADLLFRHHVLGEPFAVIAATTGTSSSALRSRAARAATRIREYREWSSPGREAATMPDITTERGQ